jgi:TRAP-type C4-dicarboxylate transport system substrate-binding protein
MSSQRSAKSSIRIVAWSVALLAAVAPALAGDRKPVKLATLAPKDSSFHQTLLRLREKWRDAPDGGVQLTIMPDGVMGGEADIVSRMRVGQIQAGVLTATGLREIDPAVSALQNLPLMFRSLEEAAYVRTKLRPAIEKRMEEKGFVLLFLGDVGWVQFFSKVPVVTPDDLKKVKLFTWAGDNEQVDLMKALDLRPVPLEVADILPGLQTGLIDAVPAVPFFALASQFYSAAPHLLQLEWAPLVGGGVITKKTWDTFPEALQKSLRESAREAGDEFVNRNQVENDQSIAAMKKRGLVVHEASAEVKAQWRAFVEPVYPRLRGTEVPAEMYDEVVKLLKELRAQAPK